MNMVLLRCVEITKRTQFRTLRGGVSGGGILAVFRWLSAKFQRSHRRIEAVREALFRLRFLDRNRGQDRSASVLRSGSPRQRDHSTRARPATSGTTNLVSDRVDFGDWFGGRRDVLGCGGGIQPFSNWTTTRRPAIHHAIGKTASAHDSTTLSKRHRPGIVPSPHSRRGCHENPFSWLDAWTLLLLGGRCGLSDGARVAAKAEGDGFDGGERVKGNGLRGRDRVVQDP